MLYRSICTGIWSNEFLWCPYFKLPYCAIVISESSLIIPFLQPPPPYPPLRMPLTVSPYKIIKSSNYRYCSSADLLNTVSPCKINKFKLSVCFSVDLLNTVSPGNITKLNFLFCSSADLLNTVSPCKIIKFKIYVMFYH